jgi:hypothetical protein
MTTVGLMARAINVPKSQVRDMANELVAEGLALVSADHIELAPATIDERLALSDLVDCYGRDRAVVIAALRALGRAD